MIYFVQGEITKKIKIGYTASDFLEDRLQPMRSSSPDRLIFLGGMPGNREDEKSLHLMFKKYHSHGEWFKEHIEIYQYIVFNCIKTIECLEIVLPDIEKGKLKFTEVLLMTDEEIFGIRRNRISNAFKNHLKDIKLPMRDCN